DGGGQRALLGEEDEVDADGEQQIRSRAGQHHGETLPERFFVEGAAALGGGDLVGGVLAEELDETAERHQRNAVFGVPAAEAQQARPETQREPPPLHATEFRDREVTHFVHEHQGPDQEHEIPRLHHVVHGERLTEEPLRPYCFRPNGSKPNFCPPTLASYMRPPLVAVKTATPFWNLASADAPPLS